MIKVRPNVVLLDLRDPEIAEDVLRRPVENILVEFACQQLDGGKEVDDGAVAIHSVVVLDDVDAFPSHVEHFRSLVQNSLGSRFLVLLGGVQGPVADDSMTLLEVPATLNRDTVRILWIPYPTASVWASGDSRARGVGVNTSEVADDFGLMTVLDVVTIPEVFDEFFDATSQHQFGPLSAGTRQAYFGRMSRQALADACREAGEELAGDRLQDPLVKPPTPWVVPPEIRGECAGFDPISRTGGFGMFLLDTVEELKSAGPKLGIGVRRGWFGRAVDDPSVHIGLVRSLGVRYAECTHRALSLFDSVDPTDGFDVDEYAKLSEEGIGLYPGRDIVSDPVSYTREALDLLLDDLHSGHSIAALSGNLRHRVQPIEPRSRLEARADLQQSIDDELARRLQECATMYPDNRRRRLVRRTLRIVDSQLGRWILTGVILLLTLLFLVNESIAETASSNLILRILGWNPIPRLVIATLAAIVLVMFLVGILVFVVDRQLKHWADASGVRVMFTALEQLRSKLTKIAVNDWTLFQIRVEIADCFRAMLRILETTGERVLDIMTEPSKAVTSSSEDAGGVNPEIRIDFNEGRDVGVYRNFKEVSRILRGDALALVEQAFDLYFDQLRGGESIRAQVVDLIGEDLDQSLSALVEVTMGEGIILRTPRKLPGGRRIIAEEGLAQRERLVRDIWADEGVIRDTVAEAVLAPSREPLMHFVHPRDLQAIDSLGELQIDLRFAPLASRPPLSKIATADPILNDVIFTEQSSLAGVLRLLPFRPDVFEFVGD